MDASLPILALSCMLPIAMFGVLGLIIQRAIGKISWLRFWSMLAAGSAVCGTPMLFISYLEATGDSFMEACTDGQTARVEWMLRLGADPNQDSEFGTPVEQAVESQRWDVVLLLAKHGGNPNAATGGRTAVRIAADAGRWDAVRALKAQGGHG